MYANCLVPSILWIYVPSDLRRSHRYHVIFLPQHRQLRKSIQLQQQCNNMQGLWIWLRCTQWLPCFFFVNLSVLHLLGSLVYVHTHLTQLTSWLYVPHRPFDLIIWRFTGLQLMFFSHEVWNVVSSRKLIKFKIEFNDYDIVSNNFNPLVV